MTVQNLNYRNGRASSQDAYVVVENAVGVSASNYAMPHAVAVEAEPQTPHACDKLGHSTHNHLSIPTAQAIPLYQAAAPTQGQIPVTKLSPPPTTTTGGRFPSQPPARQPQRHQGMTGDDLLWQLKQHRKRSTVNNGLLGGIIGLIILGPIGAVVGGVGAAVITKNSMKRREKKLRQQLGGRLHQPLSSQQACQYNGPPRSGAW